MILLNIRCVFCNFALSLSAVIIRHKETFFCSKNISVILFARFVMRRKNCINTIIPRGICELIIIYTPIHRASSNNNNIRRFDLAKLALYYYISKMFSISAYALITAGFPPTAAYTPHYQLDSASDIKSIACSIYALHVCGFGVLYRITHCEKRVAFTTTTTTIKVTNKHIIVFFEKLHKRTNSLVYIAPLSCVHLV